MFPDALSRSTIEAGLTTRYLGHILEHHTEIGSTNTRAVELARAGAPEGTLVLAEAQSAGRGRLERRWYAPAGSSLLLSLVLRPGGLATDALGTGARATMIVSLAAVEAIEAVTRLYAAIKWPNDILVNGRKVGGVLTELGVSGANLDFVVVGLGLNVNLDVALLPELITPATSLMAEDGQRLSRLSLLLSLLERAEYHLEQLRHGQAPHTRWRRRLATLGKRVVASTTGTGTDAPQESIEGIAEEVDSEGALWLRTDDGELRRVLAGDVTLRTPPSREGGRRLPLPLP